MNNVASMTDVLCWARETGEAADAIRALELIPARLGMLDADLGTLPAELAWFERVVAGQGYALVSPRARDKEKTGRRADSRVRALLKRFVAATGGNEPSDPGSRAGYTALMALIETHEGRPGSGARWNIGRHRSLTLLRARARCGPQDLTREEIDRIARELSADKRKILARSVTFLNGLRGLTNEMPELRAFLPAAPLAGPVGSSRARRMDWALLPEPFRASFDAAADRCLAGEGDYAEALVARVEAGEDPEQVMSEADNHVKSGRREIGKPDLARRTYREAITWLVRAFEDAGGDLTMLHDLRDVCTRNTITAAIHDQMSRSEAAHDLKDPLLSTTLKSRLTSLTTLARHGLEDKSIAAIVSLLRKIHYDDPLRKRKTQRGEGTLMEVDRIAAMLRHQPGLATIWSNAPARIAEASRRDLAAARSDAAVSREITALRGLAGAAGYALQMSRPMRTACLRHARITTCGDVPANLQRSGPGETDLTFRFAPWEIKTADPVTVEVTGKDAEILRDWMERGRPRLIELQGLDTASPYLFPGSALPSQDAGDPVALPRGCYAPSAFLELWRDASRVLGVAETPHRMRHVVALLILALRPGDYGFVATVLGNSAPVARKHYGRDDGQAAAREARAALLAAHPDLFQNFKRRHIR